MSPSPEPASHHGRAEDDDFLGVVLVFAFYLLCIGVSAYLYWRGTGKMPWA
jgi:hypothetical protein